MLESLVMIEDATQLHQVVMNLGSNAIQAMREGGALRLSLVYAIVTDLAGAIDVASVVGQGSTFAIYLPRV